jgi:hypothetical protein
VKAEVLVEVGDDRGERAGEGEGLPATVGDRKREAVLIGGKPSEPCSWSAAAVDDEVRAARLDGQVGAATLAEQAEEFIGVGRREFGHRVGLHTSFCQAALG